LEEMWGHGCHYVVGIMHLCKQRTVAIGCV